MRDQGFRVKGFRALGLLGFRVWGGGVQVFPLFRFGLMASGFGGVEKCRRQVAVLCSLGARGLREFGLLHFGAEYPSSKKVNLTNYGRIFLIPKKG